MQVQREAACEILGVGTGPSYAKRGSSEGYMLGKCHFCDLHRQQMPYASHSHSLVPSLSVLLSRVIGNGIL